MCSHQTPPTAGHRVALRPGGPPVPSQGETGAPNRFGSRRNVFWDSQGVSPWIPGRDTASRRARLTNMTPFLFSPLCLASSPCPFRPPQLGPAQPCAHEPPPHRTPHPLILHPVPGALPCRIAERDGLRAGGTLCCVRSGRVGLGSLAMSGTYPWRQWTVSKFPFLASGIREEKRSQSSCGRGIIYAGSV